MNCKLTEQLFSVMKLLQEEQKKPKDYGVGKPLYSSEIKLIDAVHQYPHVKVSELSQKLSITKSAVTQLAEKLIERGLIETYQIDGNKKEKYFRLTQLGETARKKRLQFYAQQNASLCTYYCTLSDEEQEIISRFLDQLQEIAPFCEFSCEGNDCAVEG